MLQLYSYFRSSASYRVRIALELKELQYETRPVHLLKAGGDQLQEAYRSVNPSALVPVLQDDRITITQSMAIIEYLDETRPTRPLLPVAAVDRAWVRALAQMVACEIHPLNNLRVLKYLTGTLHLTDDIRKDWYRHWVKLGLASIEQHLTASATTALCCHGDTPGLADCFLIPQAFNAERFHIDLRPYPTIQRIVAHCTALPEFVAAHPAQQPDTE